MSRKQNAPIITDYDAFRFLAEHPAFAVEERAPLTSERARSPAPPHTTKLRDESGFWWLVSNFKGRAIEINLSIDFVKIDPEINQINTDDPSKNKQVECWLEFGPVVWEPPFKGERAVKSHYHDTDLDCGAPTFDKAIVKLANLAMKKYGDYAEDQSRRK